MVLPFSRREFIWILGATPLLACATQPSGSGSPLGQQPGDGDAGTGEDGATGQPGPADAGADAGKPDELPPVSEQPAFTFLHGVASGDPQTDRVILWTRVSLKTDAGADAGGDEDGGALDGELLVDFVVARDRELKDVVGRGRATTSVERDYTVKIDVDGLSPGTAYFYQFYDPADAEVRSQLGRTRTLPKGAVERARFAFASCSCYALGFFHSYADIAARNDLDAVLHLGDYIYEYGPDVYQDDALGRPHEPAHEITTLDDYRRRFAQYRTDPDLQEAHRQHPFITVWDDHETANDAYRDGAENHTAGSEGAYVDRRLAALTAYHEWMPLRDLDPTDLGKIYRRFSFGDLLDLVMLETRTQRDKQDRGAANGAGRTLTGPVQAAWLESELNGSQSRGTSWRVIGQQVMMGQLQLFGQILNADQWDGYRASRDRLFDFIADEGIDNVVVLTGDIHSAWAMDLAKNPFDANSYNRDTGEGAVAVELVCSSITSPGLEQLSGVGAPVVLSSHPHMKYVDLERRGYCILDLDHSRAQGEWHTVANIKDEGGGSHSFAKAFTVEAGVAHLVETKTPSGPIPGRAELA